jgi:hypothetical protein
VSKTPATLTSVLAVAGLETAYGTGFGEGRNNWGAIQCKSRPPCGPDCFEWGDKHSDGTDYRWCYKRYATPEEGARDLADELIRRVGIGVLGSRIPRTLAAAMYDSRYYEGRGDTRDERIDGYAAALSSRFKEIDAALGAAAPSPQPGGSDGSGGLIALGAAILAAAWWRRWRHG